MTGHHHHVTKPDFFSLIFFVSFLHHQPQHIQPLNMASATTIIEKTPKLVEMISEAERQLITHEKSEQRDPRALLEILLPKMVSQPPLFMFGKTAQCRSRQRSSILLSHTREKPTFEVRFWAQYFGGLPMRYRACCRLTEATSPLSCRTIGLGR